MQRKIEPELLDHMPADAPSAMRSRRDLRLINMLMGNERWIGRCMRRFRDVAMSGIIEWGAGDGHLCQRIARQLPLVPYRAYDLLPPPASLPANVHWHGGDLFTAEPPAAGGVLVANLFLHHFRSDELEILSRWCDARALLCFCEPWRHRLPQVWGYGLFPLINDVTRHDMMVSIRAGFSAGELAENLHLSPRDWQIEEHCDWRGSIRMLAWRR